MSDEVNAVKRTLTLITTQECGVMCEHCMMSCGPHSSTRLTAKDIEQAVVAWRGDSPPGVVVFTGGEPTSLGDELYEAIAAVSVDGNCTRLVTNSSWADDTVSAQRTVRMLRDAGLNELNLSIDDYHARNISLENIERAWKAAHSVGFGCVVLTLAVGPKSLIDASFIRSRFGAEVAVATPGNEIYPQPDKDGTRYLIYLNRLTRMGRARALPSTCFDPPNEVINRVIGPCKLAIPGSVVTADNHVAICCGAKPTKNRVLAGEEELRPGNWQAAVTDLESDPIVYAIRTAGPAFVRSFALGLGAQRLNRWHEFRTSCELCETVTTDFEAVSLLRQNGAALKAAALLAVAFSGASSEEC